MSENETPKSNFIRQIIDKDLAEGKNDGKVVTRFPPEPNGYLHIGHTKSICLNFGLAQSYKGTYHLRFDDTNPIKEDLEYVEAIQEDIKWMGFDWGEHLYFASDYFPILYNYAVELIKMDKAFVCELSPEQMREYRGSLTEPGKESPSRNNSVEKNLELFERMKSGNLKEGECVLRAKIDMSSPNINMRDPIIYRSLHVPHHRTGDTWKIYPMYDYTHCLSDMTEGITHSICTLEFEDHRPLYDWVLDTLNTPCHPQQIEFAKGLLDYTIMGKRKIIELIKENHVSGWDDPRLPTVRGLRRRGYTARSIRNFWDLAGVTKKESTLSVGALEYAIREDLDDTAPRAMAVLAPIKVIIENYPEGQGEILEPKIHPKKEEMGRRSLPFGREIYIDGDDFMEDPPGKYFRLKPDGKVRLKYAYVIHCHEVIKDDSGQVTELRCTYDVETKGGKTPEGQKKVKGIIQWVPVNESIAAEVRVYDRLFTDPNPGGHKDKDFKEFLNPDSVQIIKNAWVEPSIKDAKPEEHFQFERLGYFVTDNVDSKPGHLVFNRTVTLRDTWAAKK